MAAVAAGVLVGCKAESGDGDTSGSKWSKTLSLSATDLKAGDTVITSYDGETTETLVDDKTSRLYYQLGGKRYFAQISSGKKNQGIRTNIVIDTSKTNSYTNDSTSSTKGTSNTRSTVVGLVFDMNEYDGNYDFTLVGINPTNETYYVERYTGVTKKAAADGNYLNTVGQLSNSYYLTSGSTSKWNTTAGTGGTSSKLPSNSYTIDSDAHTFTVGVDIKQTTTGQYTVKLGKITTADDGTTSFEGTTVAVIGDPNGTSDITGYDNWTHADDKDESNLQGMIAVYGFAPYGTELSATFTTGKTKGEASEAATDYVNAFDVSSDEVTAPTLF